MFNKYSNKSKKEAKNNSQELRYTLTNTTNIDKYKSFKKLKSCKCCLHLASYDTVDKGIIPICHHIEAPFKYSCDKNTDSNCLGFEYHENDMKYLSNYCFNSIK